MIAFYVTHPQVAIDPEVPVPEWGLSEVGRARLKAIAGRDWVRSLSHVFSSTEKKTVEGAGILAGAANCGIEPVAEMGENDRSATGFLPPPEFEKAADWFFANPDQSFRGWERAVDAQARIVAAVEAAIASRPTGKQIALVGHGGVGTLLKCHLAGQPISRKGDQGGGGGGNVFAFRLSDRRLLCDWTPVENFEGKF
ncbi:Broad specificity phosphatase PhoE [Mesorhizobium albiziae]|uniref:Broad specificity phosphatase PhoE n=1 Tax=Neomesorhizobium albiziae TaxID=335020 RepID=A0A1I3WYB5_9HYPH|nr:histidine phosphatase family protein [Mesorhizobium albiziae]GLS31968.1 phosphoglycerate mutase [Mesorhizobium albiziae]SFK12360.1 Broad specificity phosphatase PhoE [Mesorhizobium albiziae]